MPAGCRGCPPCRDWADHSTGGRPRLASNAEEKAGPKPGKTATRNPEEVGALRCVAGGSHAAARLSAGLRFAFFASANKCGQSSLLFTRPFVACSIWMARMGGMLFRSSHMETVD